ncbi:MAG: tetratricopeptide repeat protein [Patescibacteria group bacterium]|jgi:tetratricopeptide (TPR) repeat protein
MLFNIFPVLLIFFSVAVIVIVVGRRLPEIVALDLSELPRAVSAAGKRALLVRRLEDQLRAMLTPVAGKIAPLRQRLAERTSALYRRLMTLEARYRNPLPQSQEEGGVVAVSDVDALLAVARAAEEEGKTVDAERDYLGVIQVDHHNVAAYRGLARLYVKDENYNEARQSLEFARGLDANNDAIYSELAELAVKEGKLEEARLAYEQAANLAPESVAYRIGLGDILLQLGELPSATGAFEEAVAIESSNPRCLDRLIEVCILGGNKRLAISSLRQLKAVNPDNNKLSEFQERIAAMPAKKSNRSRAVAQTTPTDE